MNVQKTLGADIQLSPARTSQKGRAASVRLPNSSLESGHWNSAARRRPLGSAYFRPIRDNDLSTKRPLDSATFATQSRSSSAPKKNRKNPVANWAWRKPRHPG
ncbi:hypothetical protein EN871_20305 [bacterium M00.F.Ca.ET.228.01.1.1]|nr:hypothetical protein EN871_20305 [bacterium M00.F.Ca.ET.228.01.1.1]TGS00171.1 hypothetical protein EN834_18490 [bacterium M00.F.Ca.ET.191.01.1.1]TGU04492.1 hypothetical protein EN798_19310 [bacterium M00.F.Ca.ET.155.01.1.1]